MLFFVSLDLIPSPTSHNRNVSWLAQILFASLTAFAAVHSDFMYVVIVVVGGIIEEGPSEVNSFCVPLRFSPSADGPLELRLYTTKCNLIL